MSFWYGPTLFLALLIGAMFAHHYVTREVQTKPALKPEVWRHYLFVRYVHGSESEWYFDRDTNHGPVYFWKPFFKWYFSKNTPYFVINVPDRRIVIPRINIRNFETRVQKVPK